MHSRPHRYFTPNFTFAFAFVFLEVINSEIILLRFALISVSMVWPHEEFLISSAPPLFLEHFYYQNWCGPHVPEVYLHSFYVSATEADFAFASARHPLECVTHLSSFIRKFSPRLRAMSHFATFGLRRNDFLKPLAPPKAKGKFSTTLR